MARMQKGNKRLVVVLVLLVVMIIINIACFTVEYQVYYTLGWYSTVEHAIIVTYIHTHASSVLLVFVSMGRVL